MTNRLSLLYSQYESIKPKIVARLKVFKRYRSLKEEEVFAELAFCLFTPGSKAINGDRAVKELQKQKLLLNGSKAKVASRLRGLVRFHNNKAGYLLDARKAFVIDDKLRIKQVLDKDTPFSRRGWLAENIRGLGFKESSHFLRNIGKGSDLAILDTHIIKNLMYFNIIKSAPATITRKRYLEIEYAMKSFSDSISIPMDHLDLLFWYRQTGYIFK